ncbi:CDP-glycerol glycerophosphotransferase family protein [Methanobrevibacter sp.]|uniref:bifunctional glycosyltransferase/CDP-glycerol:glycerophosphate glycerophosphotransferase n=1 Tax=Methanobrevibacter sp. TaxID=66852 RepID=UPI0038905E00
MTFKISVVMAAYNSGEHLAIAMDSLINQSLDFNQNIQVIIVDDASSDNTLDVALGYKHRYPENVIVVSNEINRGASYSRNVGLNHVEGEYVNFLDSDDYMTENTFKKVLEMFGEHDEIDIASVPIYFFGTKTGEHNLNYKYDKSRVVDLLKEPDNIQLSGASAFFRFSKLKNYRFQETLKISEDSLLINQMLLKNPKIGFINGCGYYYRKHQDVSSLIGSSISQKSYFTSRVDDYFLKLIGDSIEVCGEVPKFIQYVLFYDLFWFMRVGEIKHLLDDDELREMYLKLIEILSFIDKDVIVNYEIDFNLINVHLLLLKYYKYGYVLDKSDIFDDEVLSKDEILEIVKKLDLNKIFIDIFEFRNGNEVYISGMYTTFSKYETDIIAVLDDDEVIITTKMDYPQRDYKSLDFRYAFNHYFEVTLPVSHKISFKTNLQELPIDYNLTSRLSRISKYKLSDKYIAIDRFDHIEIIKRTKANTFKLEIGVLKDMLLEREQGWRTGVVLRVLYFTLYPIYHNRRIWIFMDFPDRAEDNAIQLFKYAVKNPPNDVDKIFAVNKSENNHQNSSIKSKLNRLLGFDSPTSQYSRISKLGHAVPYGSLKHRFHALFAEAIISSNPDNDIIYPFWGNFTHLAGLVKSKTIFLQHGVTLHDVSYWLNKYNKNLNMLVAVSDYERDSFLEGDYGYTEDVVKVLGFPRFDYLECGKNKKEVVVMPTWRRKLHVLNRETFKESDFFKVYNSLLNDNELLEFLDSKGYTLVFKPHPNLVKFMDAFDRHPLADFDERSYEDIFNNSSMLVTDYSSVTFDFAYMEKPIVYFHFDRDDFHFDIENTYFKYDEMGFGPIADTYVELKEHIVSIVSDGCEMSEIYKNRVNDFFKFRDKQNSKRVYDAICGLDFH